MKSRCLQRLGSIAFVAKAALAAVAALLSACAAPTPAQILANAPRSAAGPGAARLVPYPCSRHGELLAPVDVNGHATWLLIDTGSYRHVLVPDLVKAASVRRSWRKVLVGGGAGTPTMTLSRQTELSIVGVGAAPQSELLSFEVLGLRHCATGGVLSPALLATEGTTVIVDLAGARLARAASGAAQSELAARPGARFEARLLAHALYVTDATIQGIPARLGIDTGACCTWVHRESSVGRALERRSEALSTGPSDIQGVTASHRVRAAHVLTGELASEQDVYLIPSPRQPGEPDGALGIDVLKRCMLLIEGEVMRARCELPATHSR